MRNTLAIFQKSIWVVSKPHAKRQTLTTTMCIYRLGLGAFLENTGWCRKLGAQFDRSLVKEWASIWDRCISESTRVQRRRRGHPIWVPLPPTFAGRRPWMERTRWESTYQGRPLDILRNLTETPRAHFAKNYILGKTSNAADPELVSPRDDEARIALVMVAIDHMLDRCEETMQHTGRTILCWLRSTKPQTCYPKPFSLVSLDSSKKKYRQLLKRLFAFVFRVYQMPVDMRRSLVGVRRGTRVFGEYQYSGGWTPRVHFSIEHHLQYRRVY